MTTKQIPAKLLALRGDLEIREGGDGDTSAPFRVVARSGDPVYIPGLGPVVHDFSGMAHKDRIPIDYNHDPNEAIGYANRFNTDSGNLELKGALTPFKDSDRGTEVISKYRQGVPYEASIYTGPDIDVQQLGDGETETVNNRTVIGPMYIVRRWSLRGCAITLYGRDSNTSLAMSESVEVNLLTDKDSQMSQATANAVEAAEAVETDKVTHSAEAANVAAVDAQGQATALGAVPAQKYMDAFGEQSGALYFAKGIPFDQAMATEIRRLRELNEELSKKVDVQATAGAEAAIEFSDATATPEEGKDASGKRTKIPIRLRD